MNDGLNAVLAALDRAAAPVHFFVRDDDAGWDDARLIALLDCMSSVAVPIDLAVIPHATGESLARELRARVDAAPDLLGLHQHGYAHLNHESAGRKCEFGTSRSRDEQRHDLVRGCARLLDHFADRLDPIFTPPWNRCAPDTPALLAELGYAALSRDAGAPPQQAIQEIPVHIDWCKARRSDHSGESIAAQIADRITSGATVGLMLHHAQMDAADLALLAAWLPPWRRHPSARWTLMREAMYESRGSLLCC